MLLAVDINVKTKTKTNKQKQHKTKPNIDTKSSKCPLLLPRYIENINLIHLNFFSSGHLGALLLQILDGLVPGLSQAYCSPMGA